MQHRPSHATVVAYLALFVALGGGAYAVTVAKKNSVVSKSIKNGQVKKKDLAKNAVNGAKVADNSLSGADINESTLGQVPSAAIADNATHADGADNAAPSGPAGGDLTGAYPNPAIGQNAVSSDKVADNSLTGADIADQSGVDTCQGPLTAKFGPICAGSDGNQRTWAAAMDYCAASDLRLPSLSEAITLAKNFDVPGIGTTGTFWTNDSFVDEQTLHEFAYVVDENGNLSFSTKNVASYTVCVTDPSA